MRIFHKLLVLIALVLVFEIFFILVVLFCVNNIKQLVDKQSHAQTRLNYTIELMSKGKEAGALLGLYAMSATSSWKELDFGIEDRFDNAIKDFKQALKDLDVLLENEPTKYYYRDTFEMTEEYVATLENLKKRIDKSREKENPDWRESLMILSGLQEKGDLSVRNFNALVRDHGKLNDSIHADIKAQEASLHLVLWGGIIANAVFVVLFSIYLNRNLGARFGLLRENCLRYAGGQQLLEGMKGSDEIAELDSYFRKLVGTLIDSTAKQRATFENADDIICTLDSHGCLTDLNPAFSRILGYTEGDTMRRPLVDFADDSNRDALLEHLDNAKSAEGRNVLEVELVREDETPCDILLSTRWVEREQSYFVVGHDISERKDLEKTKQEFFAMVSHELRSPLSSVSGILHMLRTGKFGDLSEKGADRVQRAESSVERLIGLINNLLDAEQLASGKMSIDTEEVVLSDITASAVNSVGGLYEEKGVRLECADDNLTVIADKERIVQVLVNLLSNAVKFSQAEGLVSITVNKLNDSVEIGVEDEGPGIPEDSRELVFERFKQLKGDRSGIKGSGLGLAICRSIIEAHGGTIGVDNRKEGGSRFWFRLALAGA